MRDRAERSSQTMAERMKKSKEILQELWGTMERNNIHIMWIPEGGEKKRDYI